MNFVSQIINLIVLDKSKNFICESAVKLLFNLNQ
jgi:hypothetical protein